MRRWFKLLGVELRKIHNRKTSYILALILVLIALATVGIKSYVVNFLDSQVSDLGPGITVEGIFEEPEITPERMQDILENHKQNAEIGKIIPGYDERSSSQRNTQDNITVIEEYIARDELPGQQENNLFRELSGNTPFNNLLIILTVVLALSIAGEYSSGTMKQMFLRPYSRTQILTTKYVAVLLYGLALVVLHYGVYFVAHGVVFGWQLENTVTIIAANGTAIAMSAAMHSVLMHLVTWLSVAMTLALVTLIAVLTRSQGATIGLTLAFGMIAPGVMVALSEFVHSFTLLPFAFMDLRPTLTGGLHAFSSNMMFNEFAGMSYGLTATTMWLGWLFYLALFLVAAILIFRKRDV